MQKKRQQRRHHVIASEDKNSIFYIGSTGKLTWYCTSSCLMPTAASKRMSQLPSSRATDISSDVACATWPSSAWKLLPLSSLASLAAATRGSSWDVRLVYATHAPICCWEIANVAVIVTAVPA